MEELRLVMREIEDKIVALDNEIYESRGNCEFFKAADLMSRRLAAVEIRDMIAVRLGESIWGGGMKDGYGYIKTMGCYSYGNTYLIIKNGSLGCNVYQHEVGLDWLEKDEMVIKEKLLSYAQTLSDGDWSEIDSLGHKKEG